MDRFSQVFNEVPLAEVHDLATRRAEEGWRYVQILAVNTEEGIDLVYSYMKDGLLENDTVKAVGADDAVPSITDLFLEAFVCENEIHDLYGVAIENIAIDFGGMFYQLAEKAPMTVVSPEQLAAREKAKKIAAAKAAKEAAAKGEQAAPAALRPSPVPRRRRSRPRSPGWTRRRPRRCGPPWRPRPRRPPQPPRRLQSRRPRRRR